MGVEGKNRDKSQQLAGTCQYKYMDKCIYLDVLQSIYILKVKIKFEKEREQLKGYKVHESGKARDPMWEPA